MNKEHVLRVIVEADFDIKLAAVSLDVHWRSLYRMLGRWKLPTPVGGNVGSVKYSEYLSRCQKIKDALAEIERRYVTQVMSSVLPDRPSGNSPVELQ